MRVLRFFVRDHQALVAFLLSRKAFLSRELCFGHFLLDIGTAMRHEMPTTQMTPNNLQAGVRQHGAASPGIKRVTLSTPHEAATFA